MPNINPYGVTVACGELAGQSVEYALSMRDGNPTKVVTSVTVTLPLSMEDIAAALWFVSNVFDEEDWQDYAFLRRQIVGTLVNFSAFEIERARLEMESLTPGTFEHEHAVLLRQLVRELFPVVPGAQESAPKRAGGSGAHGVPLRDLVGVGV